MARIFMSGFENGSVDSVVVSGAVISTTQKRTGAYSCYIANKSQTVSYAFTSSGEVYVRIGIYPTGASQDNPGSPDCICHFVDNLGAANYSLARLASGVLGFYPARCDYAPLVFGTIILPLNQWSCLEIRFKTLDSNGIIQTKINNVLDIDFTGDTQRGAANTASILFANAYTGGGGNNQLIGYIDDLAVNDTTGAVNNSWAGAGGIRLAFIDGESAAHAAEFTASAGATWQCVDEIPASDAEYASSYTVDAYDLYTLDTASMPSNGVVNAIKWNVRAKIDAGAANVTPVVRSESTTEQQTDIALSTSYAAKALIMDVDPIDDAAWTLTKVNALEVGMAVG